MGGKKDCKGETNIMTLMKTVNISDLKAHLSSHIQRVQEGEEVIVCNRSKPVARIVPYRSEDYSEPEQRLIARGALLPPHKRRRSAAPWPKPPGRIPEEIMDQVWREEREER
jgi:prevent-host-death family protein